jgi:hypothetical protein
MSATSETPPPGRPALPDRVDHAVAAGFVLALLLPSIALLAGVRPGAIEGRPPASFPTLDPSALAEPSTYAAIDRYLADRFPARTQAVGAHAAIDYGLLGGSTTPDVIVGRDGWLFTRTELEPVCTFEAAEVLAALDRTAARLADVGVEMRFIVPPDKHAIYPERIVPGSGLGEACSDARRPAMQAGMAARPGLAIELWTQLAADHAADPARPLYFAKDTHWTPLGALVGTRALIQSLAPGVWDEAQMPIEGFAAYDTDLSRLIGLPTKERVPRLVIRPGVKVERSAIETAVDLESARDIGRYRVDRAAGAVEGTTLIVYDSFFRTNERRIAPWFRDSIWVHVGDLERTPELVADLPAVDRVVVERTERGVYDLDLDAVLAPVIAAAR